MLKKRMIFTLLFDNGEYALSRNFRLQKVGNLEWLKKNYVFSRISFSIDELVILNVTRGEKNEDLCRSHVRTLSEECVIPIAAGGGILNIDQAKKLLRSGADKVVINTPLYSSPELVYSLSEEFGSQCIVASVDVKNMDGDYSIWIENGSRKIEIEVKEYLLNLANMPIGEIYFNSIDRDGTGQGYLMKMLDILPDDISVPVIMAGGAGKYHHLSEGLKNDQVDAVATAHLFNFVGDGLIKARDGLIEEGYDLAKWANKCDNFKGKD